MRIGSNVFKQVRQKTIKGGFMKKTKAIEVRTAKELISCCVFLEYLDIKPKLLFPRHPKTPTQQPTATHQVPL